MITRFNMVALFTALTLSVFANSSRAIAQTSFDGTYAGASLGYAWNELSTLKTIASPPPPAPATPQLPPSSTTSGLTGTVFAGQNFRLVPHFLVGLEADFTLSDLTGVFHNDSYRTNWGATLRARLGYEAKPGLLLYATGGFGVLNIDVVPQGLNRFSSTLAGYVIGGGVELAANLPLHARLRAEYLYGSYQSWSFDASPAVHERQAPEMHQIRLGLVIPINH